MNEKKYNQHIVLGDYTIKGDIETTGNNIVDGDLIVNGKLGGNAGAIVDNKLNAKQDKLTAGENINIENNIISAMPYYNPNKVSLFGFTPDASNNTCTFKADSSNPLEIDWGDGTKETITSEVTHTYSEPYTDILVVIKGKMKYSSYIPWEQKINTNLDFVSLGQNDITDMGSMFSGCTSLTSIPQLDTSKVTNMNSMFSDCDKLITIPLLDTSKVTNMNSMFYNCRSLATIPQLNTSNVTDMWGMFHDCSSLTSIPQLDTSKVTDMGSMFYACNSLTTVGMLDCKLACMYIDHDSYHGDSLSSSLSAIFSRCSSLKEIHMKNINADLDISDTILEHDSLIEVINNLNGGSSIADFGYKISSINVPIDDLVNQFSYVDCILSANEIKNRLQVLPAYFRDTEFRYSSSSVLSELRTGCDIESGRYPELPYILTLTLGSTLKAKLSPEEIKVATDKGWTVA